MKELLINDVIRGMRWALTKAGCPDRHTAEELELMAAGALEAVAAALKPDPAPPFAFKPYTPQTMQEERRALFGPFRGDESLRSELVAAGLGKPREAAPSPYGDLCAPRPLSDSEDRRQDLVAAGVAEWRGYQDGEGAKLKTGSSVEVVRLIALSGSYLPVIIAPGTRGTIKSFFSQGRAEGAVINLGGNHPTGLREAKASLDALRAIS